MYFDIISFSRFVSQELRVVVLGKCQTGKTSVIDTILETSATEGLVKREGVLDGRRVSLVETPGWWKTFSLNDLSNICKQQLVRRLSLTSPGPQVVLVVIRADRPFTDSDGKFLEEYVELMGANIWTHTLIIFTRGDLIQRKHIEQHVQDAGSALKRLIDKCGDKYHIFNNSNHHDRTQVTELLKKIKGIVGKNNGRHFDIDLDKVKEVNERWEEIQTNANSRKDGVQNQRSLVHEKGNVRRFELKL